MLGGRGLRIRLEIVVSLALIIVSLPISLADPDAEAQVNPTPPKTELAQLQSPFARTTIGADGHYRTELFTDPVQYEVAENSWAPIQPQLVTTNEDGYEFTNKKDDFDVLFNDDAAGQFMQLEVSGHDYQFDLIGGSPSAAAVNGSRITYPEVMPAVDLRYDSLGAEVKEALVLDNSSVPSSYQFALTPEDMSKLVARSQSDGGWAFYEEGEAAPSFYLAPPVVKDAAGDTGGEENPVSMDVTREDDRFVIDLVVEDEWLTDPDRVFPVTLDPTVQTVLQAPEEWGEDASFPWDCPTCGATTGNRLLIGGDATYAKWRAAVQFSLASIPDYAQVTSAMLKLHYDQTCVKTTCGSVSHTIEARRISEGWSTASKAASFSSSTDYSGTYTLPAGAGNQWMEWDFTDLTKKWMTGDIPNYGFLLKRGTESLNSNGPKPPGKRYPTDETKHPKLVISWNNEAPMLRPVEVVHSNGAELEWIPPTQLPDGSGNLQPTFNGYELHRSLNANFTPSATTLIADIEDRAITTFTDTTAKPGTSFTYKVVLTGSGTSNGRTILTPAPGTAKATLQLRAGPDWESVEINDAGADCENNGDDPWIHIGTNLNGKHRGLLRFDVSDIPSDAVISNAKLSLYHRADGADLSNSVVRIAKVGTDWTEGTGQDECSDDGATWVQAMPGETWSGADLTIPDDVVTSSTVGSRTTAGWDEFTGLDGLIQQWVSGETPNSGLAVLLQNEALQANNSFAYFGDDYSTSFDLRPKLYLEYTDGSASVKPDVSITGPVKDETLVGSPSNPAVLKSVATDDGRVDKVEFLIDGSVVGTDYAATSANEFSISWNPASVSNGSHSITAKAYDEVGQLTTSSVVSFMVDNSQVTTTLSNPGSPAAGTVPLQASASSGPNGLAIDRVEFYADDVLIGKDATSPYTMDWNTKDLAYPAYDGSHTLYTRAYAVSGINGKSSDVSVTVDNSTDSAAMYEGTISIDPTSSDEIPGVVIKDPDLLVDDPVIDQTYVPHDVTEAPVDSTAPVTEGGRMDSNTGTDPEPLELSVDVTNDGPDTWDKDEIRLWYRWVNADGDVMFEGPAAEFSEDVPADATVTMDADVYPPSLPQNTESATYALRLDLYDADDPAEAQDAETWFSLQGMEPLDNPVQVDHELDNKLGLEHYYQYDAEALGAGTTNLVNVSNGNSILRWTPLSSPGRGLSTVVDLTYNSLNANEAPPSAGDPNVGRAFSPVGTNFSLSISSLVRFGEPLDIQPPPSSNNAGSSYIRLTDGDGTSHTFMPTANPNVWEEPAGVNLYLRRNPSESADKRYAITRPDRVTFYFDEEGWPTWVEDKNHNKVEFQYETVDPPGPDGPFKRVIHVVDASGHDSSPKPNRSFEIAYYIAGEEGAPTPQVAGNIKTITDHGGHVLRFKYYKDGALQRIIQEGGHNADGSPLAGREFIFTYTTASGSGPALDNESDRANPPADVSDQSSRIFSVRDPNGEETKFSYIAPIGDIEKWKLESRTDREEGVTNYSYNLDDQITTVDMPEGRQTKFTYDTDGKVTDIARLADSTVNPDRYETTTVSWTPDFQVDLLTEPSGETEDFEWNANGYMTDHTDQAGDHKHLAYFNQSVDAQDPSSHVSDLSSIVKPEGGTWEFLYDANRNIDTVTDPEDHVTNYDYDLSTGAPASGMLTKIEDANNHVTFFENYDPNGFPETVRIDFANSNDLVTKFGFDDDGLMQWVQDPDHSGMVSNENNRTSFVYDSFHRLGLTSTPKSSVKLPGTLIYSGMEYDPNDNVTKRIGPHFKDLTRAVVTMTYDRMDRMLTSSGPEAGVTTEMTYDPAGRLDTMTSPEGVASAVAHDHFTDHAYDLLDRVTKKTRYDKPDTSERELNTSYCYERNTGDVLWVVPPREEESNPPFSCPSAPSPDTRPSSFATGYTYFADHMVKSVKDPEDNTRQLTYDGNGNLKTSVDAEGQTTTFNYDARDFLTEKITPFVRGGRSVTTKYNYDPVGNLSQVISPRAVDTGGEHYVTTYVYDEANRVTKTLLPKGSSETEQTYVHNTYDGSRLAWTSLPVATADPNAVPDAAKTSLTYFDPGWIMTSNDGVNPPAIFDYTPEGWQTQRSAKIGNSKTQTMTWRYYPDGQLKKRIDRDGSPVTYAYDLDNNLIDATDTSGVATKNEKPLRIIGEYDWLGQPKKIKNRKGKTSGVFSSTTYSYDRNGNVTTRIEDAIEGGSQGRKHTFLYDNGDHLETHHDLGTTWSNCSDDTRTNIDLTPNHWEDKKTVQKGSGTYSTTEEDCPAWSTRQITDKDYFDNGLLSTLTTTNGSGVVLEKHHISYLDGGVYMNGHRTEDKFGLRGPSGQDTACEPGSGSDTPCTSTFAYDARDRLVNFYDGHGGRTKYILDESAHITPSVLRAGNTTTEKKFTGATPTTDGTLSSTTTYEYIGVQLKESTKGSYSNNYIYDAQGNLNCITWTGADPDLCKQGASGPSQALVADYDYDDLSRLLDYKSYFTSEGEVLVGASSHFTYDALDRVTRRKGLEATDLTTYTYQGLSDLVTSETKNGVDKAYSYDAYGQRTGMTKTDNGQTENFTYGYDVHGNVSLLVNGTNSPGTVKASYGYSPYGELDSGLSKGDTNDLNPYRYSAKRSDPASGTYDMGARRFGPSIHSFIQPDVLNSAFSNLAMSMDPLTQNRYSMAGGNPISFIEGDGHTSHLSNDPDLTSRTIQELKRSNDEGDVSSAALAEGGDCPSCHLDNPYVSEHTSAALGRPGGSGQALDQFQRGLEVVGWVPVFGEPADLFNASISAQRGKTGDAALSAASAVTFFGWGASAARLSDEVDDVSQLASRASRTASTGSELAAKIGVSEDEIQAVLAYERKISMDDAVEMGSRWVGGRGIIEGTGSKGYNYQFRFTEAIGVDDVSHMSRFDINPADPKVLQYGPHLNLDRHVGGSPIDNFHIPIDPDTIRPGDFP